MARHDWMAREALWSGSLEKGRIRVRDSEEGMRME